MSGFDWPRFLRRWSADVLASAAGKETPAPAQAAGWLGFPAATEDQITSAEARLHVTLPPSYKAFLRTSNGWLRPTRAIDRVLGVEQVDWFRKRHRNWVSAYTKPSRFWPREKTPDDEYFAYGAFAGDFRPEHLKETLQISDLGDAAVYLLNPQVIAKDGEWEAWLFANWLPGAHRYRSFEEMMQAEYHQFAGGDWRQPEGVIGELPDEYSGSPGSSKRRVKRRTRPRPRKILGKPYEQWTVDELLEMLRNPEFDIIHAEVIAGLALVGDPRAVDPLIGTLGAGGNLAIAAMHALKKLAPQRLPDLLLEILRRPDGGSLYAAAAILAELNDDRAVPLLAKVMRDTTPQAAPESEYVCKVIAPFGAPGYNALVEALTDPDPIVRRRAVEGLYYTNRPEAREAIEPLLMDSEQAVRESARLTLELLPPPRAARRP